MLLARRRIFNGFKSNRMASIHLKWNFAIFIILFEYSFQSVQRIFLIQLLKYGSFLKLNLTKIILSKRFCTECMKMPSQRQRICRSMKWILNRFFFYYWQFVTVNDIIDEHIFFLRRRHFLFVCFRFECIQMNRIVDPRHVVWNYYARSSIRLDKWTRVWTRK